MSKEELNLEKEIMSKIKSGKIKMRSRFYFIFASFLLIFSFIFLLIILIFFTNLIVFSFKSHGPMAHIRYEQILFNFPWYILILSIFGFFIGIKILKKFDFSYKNNFFMIIILFIISILLSGFLVDYFGFNNFMKKKGYMKKIYRQEMQKTLRNR